jgi:dephospho-CoA kinase
MKLLGLTGGVGMGKSTTAQFLVKRGVSVVDTEILARQVVEPGQPALEEIQRTFGDEVIASDGRLRREILARIVFSDPVARQKLEGFMHPRIRELWEKQVAQWRAAQTPVACVVIPLLFETGAERVFDATICVACSFATQQKRLQERKWAPEQISQRIAAQFPVEKKISGANFVVWSEGGLDILAAQLDRILASQML